MSELFWTVKCFDSTVGNFRCFDLKCSDYISHFHHGDAKQIHSNMTNCSNQFHTDPSKKMIVSAVKISPWTQTDITQKAQQTHADNVRIFTQRLQCFLKWVIGVVNYKLGSVLGQFGRQFCFYLEVELSHLTGLLLEGIRGGEGIMKKVKLQFSTVSRKWPYIFPK